MNERYGDIWVCQDCYFAHHYGATAMVLDPADGSDYPGESLTGPIPLDEVPAHLADGWTVIWFAGEDDEPVGGWHEIRYNHSLEHNREPLGYIGEGFEVADNTCSNHFYGQSDRMECPCCDDGWVDEDHGCEVCEADGELQVPCSYCGSTDDENGIQEFSWSSCDGCHSPLGGGRYRLSLWIREEVTT